MTDEHFIRCDVCGKRVRYGPHRYDAHRVHLYGEVMACDTCLQANHDGWARHLESVLLGHLVRQGLPAPARLLNGLLPLGDR